MEWLAPILEYYSTQENKRGKDWGLFLSTVPAQENHRYVTQDSKHPGQDWNWGSGPLVSGKRTMSAVEITVAQFETPMYQVAGFRWTRGVVERKYLQQRAVVHSNKYWFTPKSQYKYTILSFLIFSENNTSHRHFQTQLFATPTRGTTHLTTFDSQGRKVLTAFFHFYTRPWLSLVWIPALNFCFFYLVYMII